MSQENSSRISSLFKSVKTGKGAFTLTFVLAILFGSIIYILPPQKTEVPENAKKEHSTPEKVVSFTPIKKTSQKGKGDPKISTPMDKLAEGLAEKLKENPDDAGGWTLLGRSYSLIGKHVKAVEALEKAVALKPEDPDLMATYGEALVTVSKGVIDEKSKNVFLDVIKLSPDQPVAKLNLALVEFHEGKVKEAYNTWLKLAKEAPPKAPYLKNLQSKLDLAAEKLGIEPPSILPATPPAPTLQSMKPNLPSALSIKDVKPSNNMPSDEQSVFIRSMVQRLADKMEKNPDDMEGWMKLAKSYTVLGEKEKALKSYQNALRLSPNDKTIQNLIKNLQ